MLVTSLSIPYHLSMRRPGNSKTSIVYHGAPSYMQHPTPRQLKTYTHTPSTAIHNSIGGSNHRDNTVTTSGLHQLLN